MELQILQDGVYNDQFNRAHARVAGEKHIASSIYGRSLVKSKYARLWEERLVETVEEEPQTVEQTYFDDVSDDTIGALVTSIIEGESPAQSTTQPDEVIDELGSLGVDALLDVGVSETIVVRLQVRGLGTLAQVDMTSDEELLTVAGLGSVTLEKIRAFLKEEHFEVV